MLLGATDSAVESDVPPSTRPKWTVGIGPGDEWAVEFQTSRSRCESMGAADDFHGRLVGAERIPSRPCLCQRMSLLPDFPLCREPRILREKELRIGSSLPPDEALFPRIGRHPWILITADWHQRYRPREIVDLRRYKIRHFAMPGNLGAEAMAKFLVSCANDIRSCCRDNDPPISATVLRSGGVRLVMDACGSLHERGEEKLYRKGQITTKIPYGS